MVEFFDILYISLQLNLQLNSQSLGAYFWKVFAISASIFLVLFIFQGIGTYVMAGRQNLAHRWIAFVPFLNSYLLGKLAGDCSLFGKKIKYAGLFYALTEFLACAGNALTIVSQVVLSDYYNEATYRYENFPESLRWAYNLDAVMTYVEPVIQIVYIVFFVVVVYAFYRRYAARNSWMFITFSILFPVQGALIFAVRNNGPGDYNEYMRRQAEQYYRTFQGGPNGPNANRGADPYYDPYSDPFRGDGTGRGANGAKGDGRGGKEPEDPFEDFFGKNGGNGSDDDPFGL